ncbi:hypothetical protein ACX0G9_22250 [Flavitalea flava]
MMKRRIWILAVVGVTFAIPAVAQQRTSNKLAQSRLAQSKPAIVIGMVVDQMRWDFLYRYQARYVDMHISRWFLWVGILNPARPIMWSI